MKSRVALVTGASSGFGQATAEHLQRRGYRVFGTSRRVPASGSLASCEMVPMDVDDDASVERGVADILQRAGRIDAVVNNAGVTTAGAVEDTSTAEARAQFETNFFGVLRVCRAVLPAMRAQRSGTIINISSIAGRMSTPFHGLYSASKFAVEGLSEALRMEVAPWGIRVVIVEPGDAPTGTTAHRRRTVASCANPVYRDCCEKAVGVMAADEQSGFPPEQLARAIERIIEARSPRLRYVVASPPEALAVKLLKFLPSSLVQWALMKYYRLL